MISVVYIILGSYVVKGIIQNIKILNFNYNHLE